MKTDMDTPDAIRHVSALLHRASDVDTVVAKATKKNRELRNWVDENWPDDDADIDHVCIPNKPLQQLKQRADRHEVPWQRLFRFAVNRGYVRPERDGNGSWRWSALSPEHCKDHIEDVITTASILVHVHSRY